jgi:hypothetical protein
MIDSEPGESPYPGGQVGLEDRPTKLEPFDFGEAPATVLRALERNRQLLYETPPDIRCKPKAVREKIDELLDRLLEANYVRLRRDHEEET